MVKILIKYSKLSTEFHKIVDYMTIKQLATVAPLLAAIYSRDTIGVCVGLSFTAFMATDSIIPSMAKLLEKSGMVGKDMNKSKQVEIAESLGIAAGAVYLSTMFLFFPFPFMNWSKSWKSSAFPIFPFQQVQGYLVNNSSGSTHRHYCLFVACCSWDSLTMS